MADATPQYFLDKAAQAAEYSNYADAEWRAPSGALLSIQAHAYTLSKHETEPVDPDVEEAMKASHLTTVAFAWEWILIGIKRGRELERDHS